MTSYYIFKTDNLTGKTTLVCGGSHDTILDCTKHWQCYLYGFMDAAYELLDHKEFEMMMGSHGQRSFNFSVKDKKNVEYFMLLDKEGEDLILKIA